MAEDLWGETLYDASWGDVPLHIEGTMNEEDEAFARNKYPRRSGQSMDSMGSEPRTCTARLIFCEDLDDEGETFQERFERFLELKRRGDAQVFVHPVSGQWNARVTRCNWEANAEPRSSISATVTFEEDIDEPALFTAGPGTPVAAAISNVQAAGSELDGVLALLNLASTVAVETALIVETWEDKSPTDIALDLVKIHDLCAAETARLGVSTDIRMTSAAQGLIRLHAACETAAKSAIQTSPRLVEITVTADLPLLVVAGNYYGGDQAGFRAVELLRLNYIANPARIPAGTILKGQAPSAPRRDLRDPR